MIVELSNVSDLFSNAMVQNEQFSRNLEDFSTTLAIWGVTKTSNLGFLSDSTYDTVQIESKRTISPEVLLYVVGMPISSYS